MTVQHQELAAGRWRQLTFLEQMAHIGGEVERALNWRGRRHPDYSRQASERALELIDLTLECHTSASRLKEVSRLRETVVDDFFGTNEYASTEASWRAYFLAFTYAARRDR